MAKLGPTPGRVSHINVLGNRIRLYGKPSLGKVIPRKAGVIRTSKKVLAVNEVMTELKPAKACKGTHFYDGSFQKCLREHLKGVKEKAAAKLATVA
jgi:hypothetical protein